MALLAFRRREISNDVRELQSSKDPRARFAFDYFCYRVGIHADMLAAALRGLDAFVFTAGIGENSANIRAEIVAKLAWLGAVLDAKANAAHATRISAPESRMPM
jgi:acetate kinase